MLNQLKSSHKQREYKHLEFSISLFKINLDHVKGSTHVCYRSKINVINEFDRFDENSSDDRNF
jgi:hypothetical protein